MNDLVRQPTLRGPLERDLALSVPDLIATPDGEGRVSDERVDERDTHLNGSRHTGPVRIGKVESWEKQARIGQAHPVDFVLQRVVVVYLAVIIDHLVNVASEVRADVSASSSGSYNV